MKSPETPIPFGQFMAHALHDPVAGYYARRIKGLGSRGDFTTAPTLSDSLAKAIAHWAVGAMKETGCSHLIEIGPGEGKLSAAVLRHLPWYLRWRIQLHLVETSGPLEQIQRQLLGKRATWHSSPATALAACGGNALIFSNELVDAFPVRRFEKTPAGWKEIAVRLDPIEELLLEPGSLPDSSSFKPSHPVGQRIEVHESYHQWLGGWIPLWKSGRILTIDYGSTADALYHRRPRGTVRSYLFQQRGEGLAVYENPGRRDITADVNFTDLIRWGGGWNLDSGIQTFRDFVLPFIDPDNPADLQITHEEGSGKAFLVLDQKRC